MRAIERDGHRTVYTVEGEGHGERAILFAHNLLCDRTVFDAVAARLASRALVIRVDLRGHGDSVPARAPFRTRDLALDLLAVLDREEVPRASLVGLSLGATAAVELALAAPARVERLALLGATGRADTRFHAAKNTALAVIFRVLGPRPFLVAQALPVLFGASFRKESPAEVARWAQRIARLDGGSAYRAVRCWSGRPRLLGRLGGIAIPTLVLSGDEDVACPVEVGEELARAIPGATFERVARAGHLLPLERPDAVAQALEGFLFAPPTTPSSSPR